MEHQGIHSVHGLRRRRAWKRILDFVAVGLVVTLPIIALVLVVDWLGRPPQTQAAAEAHLDRPVLDYQLWDNTSYVVFEQDDRVAFDRLRIDWISIEWPPTPRWQWTGNWSDIPSTTDPASAGLGSAADGTVVFGQIPSPSIVTLEIELDGAWQSYPVSSPGYAVLLPQVGITPDAYRWLDAQGRVVWSTDRASTPLP